MSNTITTQFDPCSLPDFYPDGTAMTAGSYVCEGSMSGDNPRDIEGGLSTKSSTASICFYQSTTTVGLTKYYTGYVHVGTGGTYQAMVEADDGFLLIINGQEMWKSGTSPMSGAIKDIVFATGGYYKYTLAYYDSSQFYSALKFSFGQGLTLDGVYDETRTWSSADFSTATPVPVYVPSGPRLCLENDNIFYPGDSPRRAWIEDADGAYQISSDVTCFQFEADGTTGTSWYVTVDISDSSGVPYGVVQAAVLTAAKTGRVLTRNVRYANRSKKAPQECQCDGTCSYGSSVSDGCVSFTQKFGTTPWISGAPDGVLVLMEEVPCANLFTTGALHYRHPAFRKVMNPGASTVVVTDGCGGQTEYRNGYAAGHSVTEDRQFVATETGYAELLTGRMRIDYDTNGEVVKMTTSTGVLITKEMLGIEVICQANGSIRQIYSLADGLLDMVTASDTAHGSYYRVDWYAPAQVGTKSGGIYTTTGAVTKSFTFRHAAGTSGDNLHMEMVEARGTTQFISRWDYVPANKNWTFIHGFGSANAVTETLATVYSNGSYITTRTITGGTHPTQTIVENVGAGNTGNALLGTTVNGNSTGTATRVNTGNGAGHIATRTDRYNRTTSYTYDKFGRVLTETAPGFGGLTEQTVYTYPDRAPDGRIDARPLTITRKLSGVIQSTTTISHGVEGCWNPREETVTETVQGVSHTTCRVYEPVYPGVDALYSEGRLRSERRPDGSMTLHEYTYFYLPGPPDKNAVFDETITDGYWNTQANPPAFAVLPGKSTRTINRRDFRGDLIRVEHLTCMEDGSFVSIGVDTFTYNLQHRQTSASYANGKTTSAAWICTGPTTETDADGIVTNYTYDALKRCVGKTRLSPNGTISESYTLDLEGRAVATITSGGSLTTSASAAYDAEGRMVSSTDPAGLTTNWSYSSDRLTTTETIPGNGTRISVVDSAGNMRSLSGTAVVPEFYSYSFNSTNKLKLTTIHYGTSSSSRWVKTYTDGFGRTVKTERPAFGGGSAVTSNFYNAKGQLVSVTATGEPTITYEYDSMGNQIRETISDGVSSRTTATETLFIKDASNIVWSKTTTTVACSDEGIEPLVTVKKERLSGLTATEEGTTVELDARGNATVTTSVFNSSEKTHTVTTTNPAMTNSASQVTQDGLKLTQTDFAGVTTAFGYDALHRQITQTDGRGNTTTRAYNNKGQLVSVTDAANHTTSYAYFTATGLLQTVTDANNKSISYTYDVKGQKLTESGDATYPVDYVYNTYGELVQHKTYRTTNTPDVTNWNYDEGSGLLASKTYADGKSVGYTYNAAGRLLTRTWARTFGTSETPLVTTYSYNGFGELTGVAYSDNVTPSVVNAYDALGRVVSTIDASGVNSKTYTDYGELSADANSILGTTLAVSYDTYGRETSALLTKGESLLATFGQTFNAATGRFASASFGNYNFAYSYHANSNLISSMTTAGGAAQKVFTYETNRDLPTEIKYQTTGATPSLIAKRNYTFDALGRVSARTQTRGNDTARSDSFGYNHRSEITSATLGMDDYAYNFDNIGNRITAEELTDEIAYTSNNLNQYTAIEKNSGTPFVPTFDDDGNQLSVQTATGVWSVVYNAENRPVTFTLGTTVIECKYDSQGRRFEKKVTTNGTVTFWQRYAYRGYLQIAAFNVTIVDEAEVYTLATTTMWDPMEQTATRPLAFTAHTASTTATYFYTHDLTKNVCELLSSSGAIVTTYDYTPFGAVTASNSATPNAFMFSSEVYAPETALVYYNYRHYNPLDGRWTNRDPIGEEGGALSLYLSFCNSINKNDYLGCFDNIYNPTLRSILEIQNIIGATPDNLYGKNTLNSVMGFQQRLKEMGYYSKDIDGKWGKETEAAYKKYLASRKDDLQGPTYAVGLQYLEKGFSLFEKACDEEISEQNKCCKKEARIIVNALKQAWTLNYGFGRYSYDARDPVGGHLCWDWSNIFNSASNTLVLNFWTHEEGFAMHKKDNAVHWFVKFYAYKKHQTQYRVNVDDGFFTGNAMVFWGQFPPLDTTYAEKEVPNPTSRGRSQDLNPFTANLW